MKRFSVTCMIQSYHIFDKDFWLDYKALEAIIPAEQFEEIKVQLMRAGKVRESVIPDKEQFQIKRAEIEADWKQKSEDAKAEGTKVHEDLQNAVISDPIYCKNTFGLPTDTLKVIEPTKPLEQDGIYTEYKMEVPINDYGILVGVADVIIKQGNKIKIIDYKTSDKIEKTARFNMAQGRKKSLAYPLCHVPDCNLNVYTLQLSTYAWMLQQLNPDLEIETLEIYHIKDYKLKKIYPVEYWKDTIDSLVKWHIKHTKLKEDMKKCESIDYGVIYENMV